MIIFNVK